MAAKGKKPRTAAQRAATRRMIAANRRGAVGRSRSPSRVAPVRRKKAVRTYGLAESGGAALVTYGLAKNYDNGDGVIPSLKRGDIMHAVQMANPRNWAQPGQPGYGNGASKRAAVVGGTALYAAGKIVKKVVPKLHRFRIKFDRRKAVALV